MAGNSFGTLFRFTSWGESHGPAIGVVVDGVPSGINLSEADIQHDLDRRRPGTSRFVTQRAEPDQVKILSGVYEGRTTGTPISLLIENVDARSKDYKAIENSFRPGHADYTYQVKYGHRDPRGGGRSSARETACRVAAGAIARKILGSSVTIRAAVVQIGPHAIDRTNWDWAETGNNPFFAPDPRIVAQWENFLDATRKAGSSAGALLEVVADGVPAGLGEPVYDKLDSDLARALMSINAVKGVEIGDGFASVSTPGVAAHDAMAPAPHGAPGGGVAFASNHAGGILGGISTGQPVVARFAVKPTSSMLSAQPSVTKDGEAASVSTTGRHDPCVGIRAAPIGEAMVAVVLADHLLRARALGQRL